jgi:hypothetical protein
LIFLDFDGVLFDTAREAYIVSRLAKNKDIYNIDEIEYSRFLDARSCVVSAWNYEPIMNGLELGLEGLELIAFINDKIFKGKSIEAAIFESEFFKKREEFQTKNRGDWLALSRPFPFWSLVLPIIKENLDKFVILSTRDKGSIDEILAYYKAPVIRVLSRLDYDYAGKSKANLIRSLSSDGKSLWIDDSAQHLSEVEFCEDIKTIWARWGYVLAKDRFDNANEVIFAINQHL